METPSLRERKAADTRVGLLEALLERLDARPLAEIPVKELCQAAGVSQATFFNYFPDKAALVTFFVRLWSVEMAGRAAAHDEADPLGAIEAIFLATAASTDAHPGILAEIVAHQARHRMTDAGSPPTDADLLRAFPGRSLGALPRDAGIEHLLGPLLRRAIAQGQLPAHTSPEAALMGVITIFFGVAVLRRQAPELPAPFAYGQQLRWLWSALRQAPPPG